MNDLLAWDRKPVRPFVRFPRCSVCRIGLAALSFTPILINVSAAMGRTKTMVWVSDSVQFSALLFSGFH